MGSFLIMFWGFVTHSEYVALIFVIILNSEVTSLQVIDCCLFVSKMANSQLVLKVKRVFSNREIWIESTIWLLDITVSTSAILSVVYSLSIISGKNVVSHTALIVSNVYLGAGRNTFAWLIVICVETSITWCYIVVSTCSISCILPPVHISTFICHSRELETFALGMS